MSYFLVGQSNSLVFLAVSRIPVGIFKQTQGLCKVSLADVTPSIERPKVFGYFNSMASAGFIVGPLIGGHIGMRETGFTTVLTLQFIGFVFMATFAWFFLDIPDNSDITREEVSPKRKNSDADNSCETFGESKKNSGVGNGFKVADEIENTQDRDSRTEEIDSSKISNGLKDQSLDAESTVRKRTGKDDDHKKDFELTEETKNSKINDKLKERPPDSPSAFHKLLAKLGKMLALHRSTQ